MKYFGIILMLCLGQLLTAQSTVASSSESFRFYQAKPQTVLKRNYKLDLRSLVPAKKAPVLLVKPIKNPVKNVWKSKKVYKPTKSQKAYQKNAVTFRYDLSRKAPKINLSVDESVLVQAFVPTHPFTLTQKVNTNWEKSAVTPGVLIENVDLLTVKMPKTVARPKNTIYPNPTHGVFNIELEQEITQIKVVNLIGHVVLSRKVNGKSFYGLDIGHLPKGTYIASFLQNDKWFSQRIVLVK